MPDLERRTSFYCERPNKFEISGCVCGNADPDWSEYKKHLWCQNCQRDFVPAHWGILDGPIPVNCCELLGIYFDTVNLETGEIEPGPSGVLHFTKEAA